MNDEQDLHAGLDHMSDEMAANGKPEPLEVRLRRLESALAAMQDTKLMEERLMERVISRIDQPMPPQATLAPPDGSAPSTQSGMMMEAGRALLPGAMRAFSSELRSATNPASGQSNSILAPENWLLTDVIFDVRTWIAMYLDYRYRATWSAKLVPLFLLLIIIWIMIWPPFPLFNYILPPILLLIVFKTLMREAARYRAMLPYLPKRIG
ncbi:MAG TPA: hypothetical protein VKS79_00885 [Gemmataceae bacterium]|nr:hypothetical protein [Gemmataceae bacterium]